MIVPLHPRTRKQITQLDSRILDTDSIRIISPIPYLEMLILEKNAKLIITDSGGVQKEAFFLNVPCLTLREETEWVETVECGMNRLVGADKQRITDAINQTREEEYRAGLRQRTHDASPEKRSCRAKQPFGNGDASQKIVEILQEWMKKSA